jgi:hypothetical protein
VLDVNTPRGERTLQEENACARLFESVTPGVRYVRTPKDSACRVDALLMTPNRMLAVVEQKSRFDCSLEKFRAPSPQGYGNEWLVTHRKLIEAREHARQYTMPLYGFLWLVQDRCLLVQRLVGRAGEWVAGFRVLRTQTQRTVNGGTVKRDNAFIDMTGCAVHYETAPPPVVAPAVPVQTNAQWLAEYDAKGTETWGAAW